MELTDTAGPQEPIGNWPDILGMKASPSASWLPAEFLLHSSFNEDCHCLSLFSSPYDKKWLLPIAPKVTSSTELHKSKGPISEVLGKGHLIHSVAVKEVNPFAWAWLPACTTTHSVFQGNLGSQPKIFPSQHQKSPVQLKKKKCRCLGPIPDQLNQKLELEHEHLHFLKNWVFFLIVVKYAQHTIYH